MDEIIKLLDKNFEYIKHEIYNNIMDVHVQLCNNKPKCSYCHQVSNKTHSIHVRKLQDLPIQGIKVIIVLHNRKMFCTNPNCSHTTFAEIFDCYS
ncbi:transposase family protein [Clostridium botulinum]|uniref:transposase family protein n=1 Tax=Clostridium botulinum TaxID=1491 RepID=UPI001FD65D38|nr:transposase family protein [Clostridium botulinum]MCJ8172683.1 transposase family protein [Clostridium botulinum]